MNYDGKLGSGGLDSHSNAQLSDAHVDLDSHSHRGHGDAVTVPDAHLLFSGDFHKSGPDLIISDQSHRVVVPDYFRGDKHPTLVSPNGAPLDPKVVEALTGHTEYAQAGGAPAAKVVGHVVKMTGSASVVRNGVTVDVQNGDVVYQSDVVQTGSGSTLGLVLNDGTTFNLSAGARLMLNDLTYDASSTSNSALFTLVQGAANFVAGQVARTGDMKVATPVATMGIRGTAVVLDVDATDGTVSISVVDQHDGRIHAVQVFNARGVLIGTVTSNGTSLTLTPTATFDVIAQESNKTVAQIAMEFNALQNLLQTYDFGKQLFPDLPQHTDNNANPQTRFAANGSSSANSPSTEYHGPAGTYKVTETPSTTPGTINIIVASTDPGFAGGSSPPSGSPPPVEQPPTSPPFVVTPPTVSPITSGEGNHTNPVMSASGDVVYDPDGIVYFYDRASGVTTRVTPENDGFTYSGQTISSDGRYVAYQGTDGTHTYVYVWGTDSSDTAHYHKQTEIAAGGSPAISGDGSTILVEQAGGSIGIYDLQGHSKGTITPASVGTSGALSNPSISADGHVIAFWSSDPANPSAGEHLYTYDVSTGEVTEIASSDGSGAPAASISADGHYLVYQSHAADGHTEISLYDVTTGKVVYTTASAHEILAGDSKNPVISPDGHFIIFTSTAQLTPGDTNSYADTYVVDVTNPVAPVYTLISEHGDAPSDSGVAISAGGLFVAFGSSASFYTGSTGGNIFVADPTSGRTAIIQETASSPDHLTAGGTIGITGGSGDVTLAVTDLDGNQTDLLTAGLSADGKTITWNFSEAKSDFASLHYGQDLTQHFFITLKYAGGTTSIPVTVDVHDAVQPVVTVTNSPPSIHDATITVSEDGTTVLTPADIVVTDLNDSSFTFKVTNVTHGEFQVLVGDAWFNTATFTSDELAAGHVRFMHDGGETAPTFSIQASDGEAVNSLSNVQAGTVHFTNVNDAPVVNTATIVVAPGDTVVLDSSVLAITHVDSVTDFSGFETRPDLQGFSGGVVITLSNASLVPHSTIGINDPDSSSFTLTVSDVTHGVFQKTADGEIWVDTTTFTTADIDAGHVRFVREDSDLAPTFSITADDGASANPLSSVFAGTVTSPPIIINHPASITGDTAGHVVEDTNTTVGGTLAVHDIDIGQAVFQPVATAALAGHYGNFTFDASTGAWTYALVHDEANGLADGQVVHDQLTVKSADGTALQVIDVTVTGTNDVPVVAAGTVVTGAIDVSAGTNSNVSPKLAAELQASGVISDLQGENGFGTLALGRSDDGSSGAINITSVFGADGINFFGHHYTSLYVNNNGNITFDHPISQYTPSVINAGSNNPIIAPFWADVDTDGAGGGGVYYDLDTADGVMTITWDHVGYFPASTDKLDTFQLVLINEGNGNFDIEYRYGDIQWTTGGASHGQDGLGGTPARVGYSAGDGVHYFELAQSGNQSALLDLANTDGNTGIAGVDHLVVRNGEVGLTSTGTIDFSDPDLTDTHSIQSVTYTGAGTELGTLSLVKVADTTGTGNGGQFAWTYTADPAAVRNALDGTDSHSKVETFDVVIGDGHGGTMTQTVSVTLAENEHHPPVVTGAVTGTATEDGAPSALNALANASDVDQNPLSVVNVPADLPAGVSYNADSHSFTLDPAVAAYQHLAAGATTTVSVDYGVSDGEHIVDASVSWTITGINDAPVATPVTLADGSEDATYVIHASDLLAHVTDVDSQSLSITAMSVASGGGSVVDNHDGTFTYTPAAHYEGSVSFNYTASDGSLTSASTASLTLAPSVTTLTFDDLSPSSGGSVIQNGYGGLDWSNFYVLDSDTYYPIAGSGYGHGTVSAPNVAFNANGMTASVSGATFDFIGADLTGAWNDGLSITADGYYHNVLMHEVTVVVNSTAPTWFEFDFDGITELVLSSHGGTSAGYGGGGEHFAMDNFTFTMAPPNEAPVFTGHDLTSIYAPEGDAVPLVGDVSVGDVDSANYADGTLTATVTDGGHEGDTLVIAGNDHIMLDGDVVMFDADGRGENQAVAIGTLTDHINSLTVDLNAHADDAAVAALAQAIEFENAKNGSVAGTRAVTFTLHDGGGTGNGGHDSASFTTHVQLDQAPVISVDALQVSQNEHGTTTVSGLAVTDADATADELFTFSAATAGAGSGTAVLPASGSGHLADINSTLESGLTYDQGANPPTTDMVTLNVADAHGASDTVNLIFNVADNPAMPVTLTGTTGKDVFFGTDNADQFVFAARSSHDTIMNFTHGQDHIDLSAVVTGVATDVDAANWFSQHVAAVPGSNDVLITIDAADTIRLHNPIGTLTSHDFILHPGGTT